MTRSRSGPSPQQMARLDDAELVALAHQGYDRAREALHSRHVYVAQRLARHLGLGDPAGVTTRAVAVALEEGGEGSFRERMLGTIRRLAEEADALPADGEKLDLEHDAYRLLPAAWRDVLWQIDVEGLPVEEVARRLSIAPTDVPPLVYRARSGLRGAYLGDDGTSKTAECDAILPALRALLDRTLSMDDQERVHAHLRTCPACVAVYLHQLITHGADEPTPARPPETHSTES